MYTAYGPRGLYWNPASLLKYGMVRVRSKYFCVRTLRGYKSGTIEKKRDSAVFWFKFEKNRWKCVGTRALPSKFGLLGKTFRSFGGDRVKRPMGMKAHFSTFPWWFLHVMNKGIKSNQLLLIQPTTNAKWSLNRRDNNPSNDTWRCW